MLPDSIRALKFTTSLCLYFCSFFDAVGNDLVYIQTKDTALVKQLTESSTLLYHSNPDSSSKLALYALSLSLEINFQKGKAMSYHNLGSLSFFQEKYDSSYYYWNLSLKEWEHIGNNTQVTKTLGNLQANAFKNRWWG